MNNVSKEQWTRDQNARLKQAKEFRDPFHEHRMENLRKRAKDLLEQFRRDDPAAIERFVAHHPNFPKESICLADAQSVIAREHGYPSWPKMKFVQEQITLTDEVERVRRKLSADGKEHLMPIITEESIKRAILKGIQSYEALSTSPESEGWAYWQAVIKPLMLEVVEKNIWLDKAWLDICYQQTDEQGITYDGLGASLEILTPDSRYPGFSLAILDLWYGRF